MPPSDTLHLEASLQAFECAQWNALAGDQPFVRYEFLAAMHEAGCAAPDTGWTPCFMALRRGGALAGAVPLYLKTHSRGEYVFDQGWAEAYARHGLPYYPKLLSAIPFTPVSGARLLASNQEDRTALARGLIELARRLNLPSLHLLFPRDEDLAALRQAGYLLREGIQFHWRNAGYRDMDDFLAAFNHDKRKKIRQDRKKVAQAGIRYRWLRGRDIDATALGFFYDCYCRTYYEHGNPPYLNAAFFRQLHEQMPDAMVLILASRGDMPVAAALNLQGADALYGRYWGSTEFVSGLHFETCYMQAIEYCIANRLARFEGGAQGEHKIARGLLPTPTWSAHWIADPRFADAIEDFLNRETTAVQDYMDELDMHAPFKRAAGP